MFPSKSSLPFFNMCFIENPSPVYFSKCKHTVDIPAESTPRMCPVAQQRSPPSWCPDPPKRTSKASSTNRIYLCPSCRPK
ncbi:hypothetical protein BDV28DRAFT_126809 [Aspergillus coremiiformis]|uniref:Uncharacterized protein n=1 Tax=Aspergillus coremiiformis TaxID=138285 RepID=A0A5N6ZFS9_9EURO|nr:hypothetical protein BDV28DRAFT_126809 [Aspergillus coremiiformis]